ncbi:PH domain-containing protein [Texcoconibacillus texcoconensis]|uniref:Putative membrane protein n=1 Tax=Texcoconibacillus texcoconensis TaxID=1095777 RepID=A0A840QQM8_9BACI|nr:PH domain-containing protein [Texcoconibacillus texcoconensis]MBB5173607.1 putative membrane protein [Texcoconibacillus texcoconensis]
MNNGKRQHPAAIFISFLSNLKELIITFIAVFIFGQTTMEIGGIPFTWIVITLILVVSLFSGWYRWFTLRYELVGKELQIRRGIIIKKNRYIRQERVQSIDVNAKLVQRIFGLVELRIETAGGGGEPEFRLIALTKEEAQRIRNELLVPETSSINVETEETEQSSEEVSTPETAEEGVEEERSEEDLDEKRWDLGWGRLIVAAMTSSSIGFIALLLAVIVSQIPEFLPEAWVLETFDFIIQSGFMFLVSLVLSVLLFAWAISILRFSLKYGYFHVIKSGRDLNIRRGVIETRHLTLSTDRITAVRIIHPLLRAPFGYVSVYVESAGGGSKDEDLSTLLIPICKKDELPAVLGMLIPEYAVDPTYESIPARSYFRYAIRLALPYTIVAGVFTWIVPFGWLTLFVIPILLFWAYMQYKDAGIGYSETQLWLRSRQLAVSEVLVAKRRIQAFDVRRSPIQRWRGLSTVEVSVLSTLSGKSFALHDTSKQKGWECLGWYSYQYQRNN